MRGFSKVIERDGVEKGSVPEKETGAVDLV